MNNFNQYNFYSSNDEMVFKTLQNARLDLIGELEAIIQYDNHIHETTNAEIKKMWEYIRNGELLHVGELLGAMFYLAPYQKQLVEQGYQRFVDRIKEK